MPERRDHLLAVAREVFVENGFAGATTNRIAAEAGTTETVMYRMFASKDELFDEAICDPLEQLILQIAALAPQFTTSAGDLDAGVQRRMLELMIEALPLFGAAVLTQQAGPDFYRRRVAPLIDLSVKAVGQMLRAFPNADIDPQVLYHAVFGIHVGLAIEATRSDPDLDIAAMASGIVDLLTHGLAGR